MTAVFLVVAFFLCLINLLLFLARKGKMSSTDAIQVDELERHNEEVEKSDAQNIAENTSNLEATTIENG